MSLTDAFTALGWGVFIGLAVYGAISLAWDYRALRSARDRELIKKNTEAAVARAFARSKALR